MRRKDREVTDFKEIIKVINECDTIRLGFQDGEYPYIVPMNFGYEVIDKQITFYVHGALEGRKIELIKKNKVCSFEMDCAHKLELIYKVKDVTMRYKCLMGKASIELIDDSDKQRAMDVIMDKDIQTRKFEYNHESLKHTMIAKIIVSECSCKINSIDKN